MPLPRDMDGSINWIGDDSIVSGVLGGLRGAGRAVAQEIRNDFSRAPTWRDFTGVSAADPMLTAGRGFAEGWRAGTGGSGGNMPDFRYDADRIGRDAAAHVRQGSVVAQGYVGRRGLEQTPGGPGRARFVEQRNAFGRRLGEVTGMPRAGWKMPGTDGSATPSESDNAFAGAQADVAGAGGGRQYRLGADSTSRSLGPIMNRRGLLQER